jgi:hypothetical protein
MVIRSGQTSHRYNLDAVSLRKDGDTMLSKEQKQYMRDWAVNQWGLPQEFVAEFMPLMYEYEGVLNDCVMKSPETEELLQILAGRCLFSLAAHRNGFEVVHMPMSNLAGRFAQGRVREDYDRIVKTMAVYEEDGDVRRVANYSA